MPYTRILSKNPKWELSVAIQCWCIILGKNNEIHVEAAHVTGILHAGMSPAYCMQAVPYPTLLPILGTWPMAMGPRPAKTFMQTTTGSSPTCIGTRWGSLQDRSALRLACVHHSAFQTCIEAAEDERVADKPLANMSGVRAPQLRLELWAVDAEASGAVARVGADASVTAGRGARRQQQVCEAHRPNPPPAAAPPACPILPGCPTCDDQVILRPLQVPALHVAHLTTHCAGCPAGWACLHADHIHAASQGLAADGIKEGCSSWAATQAASVHAHHADLHISICSFGNSQHLATVV